MNRHERRKAAKKTAAETRAIRTTRRRMKVHGRRERLGMARRRTKTITLTAPPTAVMRPGERVTLVRSDNPKIVAKQFRVEGGRLVKEVRRQHHLGAGVVEGGRRRRVVRRDLQAYACLIPGSSRRH